MALFKIQREINDLVERVTQSKNLLMTTPLLVEFFDGDHNAAIFMNQVLYWSDRTKDPEGWFYKTNQNWFEELALSDYQVRRVIYGDKRVQNPKQNLSDVGLETQVRMAPNGRNATFYRLDIPQFVGIFTDWLEKKFGDFAERIKSTFQTPPKTEPSVGPEPNTPVPTYRPKTPSELVVEPTERVQTAWENRWNSDSTVTDAWTMAQVQLEIQFDRANFNTYLKDVTLVDYDPDALLFTFAVEQEHAANMLQHRLYRNVRRVVSDAFGQEVELAFVTHQAWHDRHR